MSTGDKRASDEPEAALDRPLADRRGREDAPLERVTTQTITESYVIIDHRVVRRDDAERREDEG